MLVEVTDSVLQSGVVAPLEDGLSNVVKVKLGESEVEVWAAARHLPRPNVVLHMAADKTTDTLAVI